MSKCLVARAVLVLAVLMMPLMGAAPAMSLSLLKFAGQASLVDEVMLPS